MKITRMLSIQNRLVITFSIAIALIVLLGFLSLFSMKNIRSEADLIETNILPAITSLGDLNSNLMRVRIYTLRIIGDDNDVDVRNHALKIDEFKKKLKNIVLIMKKLFILILSENYLMNSELPKMIIIGRKRK